VVPDRYDLLNFSLEDGVRSSHWTTPGFELVARARERHLA
jgi:hypothetical protein